MSKRTATVCGHDWLRPTGPTPKYCSDQCRPRCSECERPVKSGGLCAKHYFKAWQLRSACEIDECGLPVTARGMCSKHLARLRKHGDARADVRAIYPWPGVCSIEGCERTDRGAGGLCTMHYARQWNTGHTDLDHRACLVASCERPYFGEGYCRRHHWRVEHFGDARAREMCSVDTCERKTDQTSAKGLCRLHYKRLIKYGDIRGVRIECGICETTFFPVNSLRKVCDSCMETEIRPHYIDIQTIIDRDGTECSICHEQVDLDARWPAPNSPSIDHIIPWSLGGTHALGNLALACLVCNIRKGNRIPA